MIQFPQIDHLQALPHCQAIGLGRAAPVMIHIAQGIRRMVHKETVSRRNRRLEVVLFKAFGIKYLLEVFSFLDSEG